MEAATPFHAPAMAAIHALAFPPGARWGADAMALQLGLPGAFGWIDAAGGFVLARVAADEAEVLTLAVAAGVQKRGIGRGLLSHAITSAARLGATSMVLEVAVDNTAGLALYGSAGFRQVGRRAGYYGRTDALIMRTGLCGSTPS